MIIESLNPEMYHVTELALLQPHVIALAQPVVFVTLLCLVQPCVILLQVVSLVQVISSRRLSVLQHLVPLPQDKLLFLASHRSPHLVQVVVLPLVILSRHPLLV